VVIGSKVYIGMGTVFCHDWKMYDPVSDTWTSKATLTDTASGDPPVFSLKGFGYVLCDNNHLWQYDTLSDTWTRMADCPGNIGMVPYFFSIADTGNVTGGIYSGNLFYKELWAYNSGNNTWSRKADMPQGNAIGEGFSVNGKGYVAFGMKNYTTTATFSNEVFEYNPQNNTWTKKNNAPDERYAPSSFVIGNKAYIGMGLVKVNGVDSLSSIFYEYEPLADVWTKLAPIPDNGIWDEGIGFAVNGVGYMGLGDCNPCCASCTGYYPKIHKYTPAISGIEKNNIPGINIFPNPSSGEIKINTGNKKGEMVLYDISGREVMSLKVSSENNCYNINISELNSGIYMMKMIMDTHVIACEKIILLK